MSSMAMLPLSLVPTVAWIAREKALSESENPMSTFFHTFWSTPSIIGHYYTQKKNSTPPLLGLAKGCPRAPHWRVSKLPVDRFSLRACGRTFGCGIPPDWNNEDEKTDDNDNDNWQ